MAGAAPAQLDFALTPGATIRGKFARADGTPAQIPVDAVYGEARVGNPHRGPSYTGSPHRHAPNPEDPVFYEPGSGPYYQTTMFFPTADSFTLLGVVPGKATLHFDPNAFSRRIARMLLNGKPLRSLQLDVEAGQSIDGVTIELQDEATGTAGHN